MCRFFFEHNLFLRSFGQLGFQWAEKRRAPIMLSAFFVSTLGWAFTIAACVAYTNADSAVRATYWGWGDVDNGSVLYFVGLRRLLFKRGAMDGSGAELSSLSWGDEHDSALCETPLTWKSKTNGGAVVETLDGLPVLECDTCEKAANGIIRLVVVSCVTQVFQMTTDLQRTTRYGDMNCQKLFGCTTSLYGFASAFASLVEFRVACGLAHTFPPWFKTSQVAVSLISTGALEAVDVSFYAGPGYVLLFLAVLLKAYDALCHLAVPCPKPNSWPLGDPRAAAVAGSSSEHDLLDNVLTDDLLSSQVGGGNNSGSDSPGGEAAAAAAAVVGQPHAGSGSELSGSQALGNVRGKDHWRELSDYMRLSVVSPPPPPKSTDDEVPQPTSRLSHQGSSLDRRGVP